MKRFKNLLLSLITLFAFSSGCLGLLTVYFEDGRIGIYNSDFKLVKVLPASTPNNPNKARVCLNPYNERILFNRFDSNFLSSTRRVYSYEVWNISEENRKATIENVEPGSLTYCAAFSDVVAYISVNSDEESTVCIFDTSLGEVIREIPCGKSCVKIMFSKKEPGALVVVYEGGAVKYFGMYHGELELKTKLEKTMLGDFEEEMEDDGFFGSFVFEKKKEEKEIEEDFSFEPIKKYGFCNIFDSFEDEIEVDEKKLSFEFSFGEPVFINPFNENVICFQTTELGSNGLKIVNMDNGLYADMDSLCFEVKGIDENFIVVISGSRRHVIDTSTMKIVHEYSRLFGEDKETFCRQFCMSRKMRSFIITDVKSGRNRGSFCFPENVDFLDGFVFKLNGNKVVAADSQSKRDSVLYLFDPIEKEWTMFDAKEGQEKEENNIDCPIVDFDHMWLEANVEEQLLKKEDGSDWAFNERMEFASLSEAFGKLQIDMSVGNGLKFRTLRVLFQ